MNSGDTIVQRYRLTLVLLDHWTIGTIEQYSVLVLKYNGTVVLLYRGTVQRWYCWTVIPLYSGTEVKRYCCTEVPFVPWYWNTAVLLHSNTFKQWYNGLKISTLSHSIPTNKSNFSHNPAPSSFRLTHSKNQFLFFSPSTPFHILINYQPVKIENNIPQTQWKLVHSTATKQNHTTTTKNSKTSLVAAVFSSLTYFFLNPFLRLLHLELSTALYIFTPHPFNVATSSRTAWQKQLRRRSRRCALITD